ncbi:MAG TPA: hypothetical protein VGL23_08425 [Chloroflexota bacterium]
MKLPWQLKFLLRAVGLGGLMLVLGAILFASGRPTSAQREIGLVLLFGALPFGVLIFVVSWLRRRAGLARQARSARRIVPGVGAVPERRPARPRPAASARGAATRRPGGAAARR